MILNQNATNQPIYCSYYIEEIAELDLGMIAPEKVCHVVEIFSERVDNNNQDWPQIRNKKLLIIMICCGHFQMLCAKNQEYKKLQANMLLILMRCCGPFSVHPAMHQNFDHTIALQFLQHMTPYFAEDNPFYNFLHTFATILRT